MIELYISKRFRILIDFTFFAVIALFLSLDKTGYGLMSIAACLIHEMGHLFVMLMQKKIPSRLTFYGAGIKITKSDSSGLETPSVSILLAGSLTNFAVFFAVYFTAGRTDIFPVLFAVINLVIGVFNLIPVSHFDGKKLLEIFCIKIFTPKTAMQVLRPVEIFFLILVLCLAVLLFIMGFVNFTMAVVLIYLFFIDIVVKM